LSSDSSRDRQSDAALIARFVAVRDEEAFRELVRRHGPMVLSACARVLRHRQDAEDAFQAVFVILAARGRALRRVRSLGGWLHNVAVHVSYRALRGNRRRTRRLFDVQRLLTTEKDDHVRELQNVLDEELTALPAKYREALVLCDLEGHTREEAAKILNTSAGTVGTWVTRGRRRLRDRLVRRGVTLGAGGLAAVWSSSGAAAQLSAELVQQTLRHAELFLLTGTRVASTATAAKITSLAHGELNRMFLTKLSTTVGIVALAVALVLGASPFSKSIDLVSRVRADTIFFDDFNDGSAMDGSPVTWIPVPGFNTGTFSAATGDYVLTQPANGAPQVVYPNILPLGTTSIRSRVRELQGSGPISLFGRFNTIAPQSGYQAGIEPGGLYIVRTNAPFNNTDLASTTTDLNPSVEDVFLQFDMIGSQLNLFAWRAGDAKPNSPTLSAIDNTFPTGIAGILIDSEASHSIAFRFVHVADMPIPEPTSVALGSLGFVALASFAFRTRLNRVG
jgi:RNA polymerase sigma factor (sigma-70 family)